MILGEYSTIFKCWNIPSSAEWQKSCFGLTLDLGPELRGPTARQFYPFIGPLSHASHLPNVHQEDFGPIWCVTDIYFWTMSSIEWFFGFPPSSVVVLRVAELGVITSNWRERQEIWIYCGPACFAHLSYGGGKKNPKTVLISFQGMMGKYMNAVYPKRNYPVIGSSSLVDFLHTVHVVSHFCWKLLQAVWALTTVLSFWIRTGNGIIMTTVC